MKITPELLARVAVANQATHQVGDGIRDGVDWAVGRDLGLIPPHEAAQLPISPEAALGAAPIVGRKALTIAQMNDNERRYIARARAARRASGF